MSNWLSAKLIYLFSKKSRCYAIYCFAMHQMSWNFSEFYLLVNSRNCILDNIFVSEFVILFYFIFRIEKVEYEAFCAWTLLKTDGLLFPSDLSIGLIRNKNQYYAFSSVEAAELFMQNPDAWVKYWCLFSLLV